ncbi:MAG: DUF4230 domain-containing protein [Bacteroidaceae bacterium]|nr:DUF4230 domain-containing protein [Bacteroidaceae bacterium]
MFQVKKAIKTQQAIFFAAATLVMLSIPYGCSCSREKTTNVVYDSIESEHVLPGTSEILSQLRQSADLATTEVTIRKIAIYDSNKNERFSWTSPSTWKYGERKCIIPVEVKIKYGYDLRELQLDDIKLTDDSTAVIVYLPKPKIIDAGYNAEIDRASVTSISTGLRDKIGHQLEEEIRRKGYEAVLKEDLSGIIGKDIEQNAKTLFESIIKSLGWDNVQIYTTSKK